jgi:hypothetical protein
MEKEAIRQHAGLGEQHARGPLLVSNFTTVFGRISELGERDHSGRSGWHVASRLFLDPDISD